MTISKSSLYSYRWLKNLKEYTHILSIIYHLCIKFQIQYLNNEGIVKNKISDISKFINLSEISSFCCAYIPGFHILMAWSETFEIHKLRTYCACTVFPTLMAARHHQKSSSIETEESRALDSLLSCWLQAMQVAHSHHYISAHEEVSSLECEARHSPGSIPADHVPDRMQNGWQEANLTGG
jgi:hypothetical protein